jgi:hypothetical protein
MNGAPACGDRVQGLLKPDWHARTSAVAPLQLLESTWDNVGAHCIYVGCLYVHLHAEIF